MKNKPQWLIDAENEIQNFADSKYGKMNSSQLNRSVNGMINGKKSEKINMEIAKEIRNLYNTGNYTQIQLANKYGYKGSNTISEIIQNITYIDSDYIAPNNTFFLKKNLTIVKILNALPDIFTSKDMANQIIKFNIRSSDKLAMKEARRILLIDGYFQKLPTKNGKPGNQHNPQFYKKIETLS